MSRVYIFDLPVFKSPALLKIIHHSVKRYPTVEIAFSFSPHLFGIHLVNISWILLNTAEQMFNASKTKICIFFIGWSREPLHKSNAITNWSNKYATRQDCGPRRFVSFPPLICLTFAIQFIDVLLFVDDSSVNAYFLVEPDKWCIVFYYCKY